VVNHTATFQLPASTIDTFKNEEYEMMVQDRQIRELQERKNDLESYIYSMRDRVSGGNLSDYIAQADKDTFLKLLEEVPCFVRVHVHLHTWHIFEMYSVCSYSCVCVCVCVE
jgi:molecular chaperone DnaK (HSP70)